MMVLGWQSAKLTLPIAIYAHWETGELPLATAAMVALALISLALTLAYNRSAASKQD